MPSPPPRSPHEAPKSGRRESWIRCLADTHRDHPDRQVVAGHHNVNYVVPLGWRLAVLLNTMPFRARVKCRMPRETVEVVPRIWPSETDLLAVVSRHLKEVPRCFRDFGDWSLHSYRAGRALSDLRPQGPVGERLMGLFADFFARTAAVPDAELPPRPDGWPRSENSQGFLHWLIRFTEEEVHQANLWRFDDLFAALGIPSDAMARFRGAADRPSLTPRPFCLLHTDVHRANVIVDRKDVAVIDWELAMYGDPLHELATHLVRMDYPQDEQAAMESLWSEAMRAAGLGRMTEGMATDLQVYLDFEYAQSVFPDVMRAALDLTGLADGPEAADYAGAAARVGRALRRAAGPLKLEEAADEDRAEQALRDWYAGPFGRALADAAECRAREDADGADDADEWGRVPEPTDTETTSTGPDDAAAQQLAPFADLLTGASRGCVLFDFDGPVCRLFPDGSSRQVADALRDLLRARGVQGVLTPEEERSIDPHDVLRAMDRAFSGSDLVGDLETLLTSGEVAATYTAPPTPGAHRLIRELRSRGVRIAVVTNNSPRAVAAYLHLHGLTDAFGPHVYGRTAKPGLLKPHPDSLNRALLALGAEPGDALMIGDKEADLLAARDAKVSFVGYAGDPAEAVSLRVAGAELVLSTLRPLLAVAESGPPGAAGAGPEGVPDPH
ncbi:HAD-IA family hydrolase [Streptomyces sp. NPDC047123]|uniref:HAD-IA family hydrolase n=1 Tax=Streptomyces sp. NPDC047123 TaxID=3155622 RepID=UPI0033F2E292